MKTGFSLMLVGVFAIGAVADAERGLQSRVIPDAPWVKIFFEDIDRLAGQMKLKPLRTISLPAGDVEVRVWEGFGLGPLTGYILRRSAGRWSAHSATQLSNGTAQLLRVPPSTDWAVTWERLRQQGFTEIKDDSERRSCVRTFDGVGYVVEVAEGASYRTYFVSNPQTHRSEDGDRFLRLLPVMLEAFGKKGWVDVADLPTREYRNASTVVTTLPALLIETAWTFSQGQASALNSDVTLSGQKAMDVALNIHTPSCEELPPALDSLRFRDETGDVAVELLVDPNGTVRAARARSGFSGLHAPSVDAALNWKFETVPDGTIVRRTLLTIRYREALVDYPWLRGR
jgi:hypothetical protein